MTKREKAVEAGRELRQIQREHLRAVAREMKEALEDVRGNVKGDSPDMWRRVDEAIAKARRLGL